MTDVGVFVHTCLGGETQASVAPAAAAHCHALHISLSAVFHRCIPMLLYSRAAQPVTVLDEGMA